MSSSTPGTAPGTLRVASYNIFKARYFEGETNGRGPVRAVLEDVQRLEILHGADVLALQEAIVGPLERRGAARHTVQEVARRMGVGTNPGVVEIAGTAESPGTPGTPGTLAAHVRFRGSRLGAGREWGVGLVCREPARFHAVELPKAFWSPWRRWALIAEMGPWIVCNLHLEVWPLVGARSRRVQIETILDALERVDAGRGAPAVLAGDFNCEPAGGPHRIVEHRGFSPAVAQRQVTFRSAGLRLHLDHIYVRNARILEAGVEPRARGSDHRPIWATLVPLAPA